MDIYHLFYIVMHLQNSLDVASESDFSLMQVTDY